MVIQTSDGTIAIRPGLAQFGTVMLATDRTPMRLTKAEAVDVIRGLMFYHGIVWLDLNPDPSVINEPKT